MGRIARGGTFHMLEVSIYLGFEQRSLFKIVCRRARQDDPSFEVKHP